MFDQLSRNPKLLESFIKNGLSYVPEVIWKRIIGELGEIAKAAQGCHDALLRIETKVDGQSERIDFLEGLCRAYIPDAGVVFAERDMYMPDRRTSIAGIPIDEIMVPGRVPNPHAAP